MRSLESINELFSGNPLNQSSPTTELYDISPLLSVETASCLRQTTLLPNDHITPNQIASNVSSEGERRTKNKNPAGLRHPIVSLNISQNVRRRRHAESDEDGDYFEDSSVPESEDDSESSYSDTVIMTDEGELRASLSQNERDVNRSQLKNIQSSINLLEQISNTPHASRPFLFSTPSSSRTSTIDFPFSEELSVPSSKLSQQASKNQRLRSSGFDSVQASLQPYEDQGMLLLRQHRTVHTTKLSTVRFTRCARETPIPGRWAFTLHIRVPKENLPEILPLTNLECALVSRLRRQCNGGASYCEIVLKPAVVVRRRIKAIKAQRSQAVRVR